MFFPSFESHIIGESMSVPEEEPYSTMFSSLRHPIRRKILRMLSEKARSFSEMLEASGVSSSHLTYHLENLGQLVSKTDNGKYILSKLGEAAVAAMSRVEETPRGPKHLSSLPLKWKSLFAALLIGVVILGGVSYTQYQSLNRISAEYERLLDSANMSSIGALNTTILNATLPSNATLANATIVRTGVTETCWGFEAFKNGTLVAYGPLVIPSHVEELTNGALVIVPNVDMQSLIANSSKVIADP